MEIVKKQLSIPLLTIYVKKRPKTCLKSWWTERISSCWFRSVAVSRSFFSLDFYFSLTLFFFTWRLEVILEELSNRWDCLIATQHYASVLLRSFFFVFAQWWLHWFFFWTKLPAFTDSNTEIGFSLLFSKSFTFVFLSFYLISWIWLFIYW